MEVCYWALLFMPLVISHHLLNVFVQFANKRGFKQNKKTKKISDHKLHKHQQECRITATLVNIIRIFLQK
jgi:hypothetical protein